MRWGRERQNNDSKVVIAQKAIRKESGKCKRERKYPELDRREERRRWRRDWVEDRRYVIEIRRKEEGKKSVKCHILTTTTLPLPSST
jgi:hypothetical protein